VASENTQFSSDGIALFDFNKTELRVAPQGITTYTVPEGVTIIRTGAFENNPRLTSVTLASTVTTFQTLVFHNCTSLTSITLPATLTAIGANAFQNCTSLKDVVMLKASAYSSNQPNDAAFADCDFDKLKLWIYPVNATRISSYVVGKGKDNGDETRGDIKYGYLLHHITLDAISLNNGASQTLVPKYFATGGVDEAKDALVETPAITEASIDSSTPSGHGGDVVTVDNNGKVTAVGDGVATITVKVTSLSGDVKTATCTVTVTTPDATITKFELAGKTADISPNGIITVEVPAGTDLTNLTPTITSSGGASVSLQIGTANNFTDTVIYRVSQNSTTNSYTVIVTMPQDTPNVGINYVDETLTGLIAGVTYSFNGTQETVSGTTREIDPDWFGTELSIVRKGSGRIVDSAAQVLPISARPNAPDPEGITVTNESIAGKSDGKLAGITADMEYRSDGGDTWTTGNGNEIGNLAAGDYQVRVKQAGSNFAGTPVTVNVAAGVAQTRILTVTAPSFTDVTAGYTRPDAAALTIANSGNSTANISTVIVSPETAFEINGSDLTVDPGDEIDTWTIQPKAGLSAGTYNAAITVTYNGTVQTTATANVSFTVNAVVIPPPATDTYALTVIGGTDNTNAGPYEEGAEVSITAGEPADGKVFDKWTSSAGGSFTDATKESTIFTMPDHAVTVTATYKDDPNAGDPDDPDNPNPPDNPPATDSDWVYEDGTWKYLVGGEVATGWIRDDGAWYYLAATGAMETGWVYDGGTWYYLSANGAMKTGWLKVGGSWYYLAGNGAMVASKWFKDTNGSWYYLSGNGKMLTGKQTIGGKVYSFKSNGVWVS
jgi:uncharacterized repeat protein (TIGR02543 family)